jgi:hypothetical protein
MINGSREPSTSCEPCPPTVAVMVAVTMKPIVKISEQRLLDGVEWFAAYVGRAKLIPGFWNEYPKATDGAVSAVVKGIYHRLDEADRKALRKLTKHLGVTTRLNSRGIVAFQAGILAAAGFNDAAAVDPTLDEGWKRDFLEL